MKTFVIWKKFFAMEYISLLFNVIFLTSCFSTTTGIAEDEYRWETVLLKKGTEDTKCHLVWLKNPNSVNASSSDLLLTSAFCLIEKLMKSRKVAKSYHLPNPNVFSISSVKYDAKWNEIDRIDVGVKNVILHPKFNADQDASFSDDVYPDDFDIAMVKIEHPIDQHDQLVFDALEKPSALSGADNCSVTGQIEEKDNFTKKLVPSFFHQMKKILEPKRQSRIHIEHVVQRTNATYIADLPNAYEFYYQVPLGTPLICTKNHTRIVRGLTTRRRGFVNYNFDNGIVTSVNHVTGLNFISPAVYGDWILATANEIDHVKKPFHDKLHYKSTHARDGVGSVPLPDHIQLLDDLKFPSDDDAVALWYEGQVHSKINVFDGTYNLTNARGYTKELDAYRCAVTCFKWNNGHPCSYDFSKKVCYFLSTSKVEMAYEEGISISFKVGLMCGTFS